LSHNKNGDDDHDVIVQKDIETIKQLPPAQPEQKSCKTCHLWEDVELYDKGDFKTRWTKEVKDG